MEPFSIAALVSGAFDLGGKLIDRLIPDPTIAADAKLKLAEMAHNGELQKLTETTKLATAQIDVNKIEAASTSAFRGNWRPAVGWVCVCGLGYQIILRPLLEWATGIVNAAKYFATVVPVPPSIDLGTLLTLLFGMLGLGAYRSYEKVKGLP